MDGTLSYLPEPLRSTPHATKEAFLQWVKKSCDHSSLDSEYHPNPRDFMAHYREDEQWRSKDEMDALESFLEDPSLPVDQIAQRIAPSYAVNIERDEQLEREEKEKEAKEAAEKPRKEGENQVKENEEEREEGEKNGESCEEAEEDEEETKSINVDEFVDASKDKDFWDSGHVWCWFIDAVYQLTDYNDKLVDLIAALAPLDMNKDNMFYFQMLWRDFALNYTHPVVNDPRRKEKLQALLNFYAFLAKMASRGIPHMDYRSWAGVPIVAALEKTPWEYHHHPDVEEEIAKYWEDPEENVGALWDANVQLEQADIRHLDSLVPLAAIWFKVDAQSLWDVQGPLIGDRGVSLTNWNGVREVCKERWAYWIERFEWIAQVTVLEPATRQAATEAAELMKKVDTGA